MKREQILAWLPFVGAQPASDQSRTGWVVARCPFGPWSHSHGDKTPSFGVKIQPGDSFTHCFSCGFHGSQADLVLELRYKLKQGPVDGGYQLGKAMELVADAEAGGELANLDSPDIGELLFGETKQDTAFPDDWLASFAPALSIKAARNYLQSRGVPEVLAEALDLRADTKLQRICFPVRDFNERLRGLHGRTIIGAEPRYRMYPYKGMTNADVWLGEHWVDVERPVLMVEGPFDLASVLRVYRNSVSPLFANPSFAKLHRMSDALEWVTLLDRGKGGDQGREKIDKFLGQQVVTHLLPPEGKDPGASTVDELVQILSPHLELDEILLA